MEEWKPVTGYEDSYEVSNFGLVRSVDRVITRRDGVVYHRDGRILANKIDKDGYFIVRLNRKGDGRTFKVHRLVYEAFARELLPGEEIDHIDFNRQNNHIENLQALTHKNNIKRTVEACRSYGRKNDLRGTNNPNYGNHKLAKRYESDTELSTRKQSRPGKRNGRSVPVVMISPDGVDYHFDYLRECANALVDKGATDLSVEYIANKIKEALTSGNEYLGYYFKSESR